MGPTINKEFRNFYDRIFEEGRWVTISDDFRDITKLHLNFILKALNPTKEDHIADLGCGTAHFSRGSFVGAEAKPIVLI